jgi:hypothetical protein
VRETKKQVLGLSYSRQNRLNEPTFALLPRMCAVSPTSLSTEMAILVMCHLTSPRDIFAFIRMSKWASLCFSVSKTAILVSVIRNALGPDLLPDAVAACEASQTSQLSNTPIQSPHCVQGEFIERYAKSCKAPKIDLHDRTLVLMIYKLRWIADAFLSSFQLQAFQCATTQLDFLHPKSKTTCKRPKI